MPPRNQSFGEFARSARIKAGFGLREAARGMSISAAYLSRVENDVDPASAELIRKLAQLYQRPLEDFNAATRRPSVSAEVRGREIQSREELRTLYRMGELLTRDELEDVIRSVLKKRGLGDEDIERELARLRAELPRIRHGEREDLLAADIKPRFLSKRAISEMAEDVLRGAGLGPENYVPPTPIERLVECQDGIAYKIDDLPSKKGSPIVLGLSKWSTPTERQIIINSTLADGAQGTSEHRFNFTLAHELFHAIEHLPLAMNAVGSTFTRLQFATFIENDRPVLRQSPAERAVARWAQAANAGALVTNEDWREWQANRFASCVLMPSWAVIAEFQRRLETDFLVACGGANVRQEALELAGETMFGDSVFGSSLADQFDVSRQAMAIRLLDLGLVREVSG